MVSSSIYLFMLMNFSSCNEGNAFTNFNLLFRIPHNLNFRERHIQCFVKNELVSFSFGSWLF